MIIYITFALICTLIGGFGDSVPKKHKNIFLIALFSLLFLFMGLRYGVGQDYFFTYVPIFESVLETGQANGVERGFIFINKFIQLFTNDYAFLFLFISFLFILFIILTIKQYDISILLSIFILVFGGFYFYAFNVTRQCITFAMFFLSLKYAKKKSILPYMLINALGFLIHTSAIIYLPLYFVISKNLKFRWYLIGIIICFTLRLFARDILETIFKDTKYFNYLTGYYADTSSNSLTASQLINIAMFIIYLVFTKKSTDINIHTFKNIHYFGVLASIFVGVVPLAFRITTMFYFVQFVSFPYLYKSLTNKTLRGVILVTIVVLYVAIFLNMLLRNGNNIIPYRTIFER